MPYDSYNAILKSTNQSNKEKQIKHTKKVLKSTFSDSPSYHQVTINGLSDEMIDCWITNDSKVKELKQIQLVPDKVLSFGDVITWQGDKWLTTLVENRGDIYFRGSIQKCISSLKWLDSFGVIQEVPFTYRIDFYRGAGIDNGKVIMMAQERRYIYVQKNEDTLKLLKGQRFIFDSRAWKLTAIDSLLSGLIYFELEENDIDHTKDSIDLRIADYYRKVSNYKVSILNKETTSIYVGSSFQLNLQCTNRGEIISVPVSFRSSNESIASIDHNGMVKAHRKGEVTITATYENVSDSITINVLEQIINNYSVDVVGSTDIRYSTTLFYKCIFRNNGFEISDTSEYWLTAEDGLSQTKLASIIIQDSEKNTCSIKASKTSGYVKLHVKNKNSLINGSILIQIKSPLEN
ncbi:Ig-like domain-containing protein [Paenibacillus radicibacter]|uniref:Ig-like domain-containing protein n=1 Tax=Paenibacillus radicibacter TaxID=2972488 RepID=UPI00215945B2|nr:Ig-like domain-containing protein [Paenibacillus radicibacter]